MRRFFTAPRGRHALLAGLWLASAGALSAPADFEFDVRSPSVMAIRKSLGDRHVLLKEHFQAGAIGNTHDGMIALREPAGLAPELRGRLEALVREDNKDRGTLYREIARANGRPDWESQFQHVFAERWILRAPAGWYHRNGNGLWTKKTPAVNGNASAKPLPVTPFPGS